MPHFPQGDLSDYRSDDLGLPLDSGSALGQPALSAQQADANESHAAYLCSHGLRWPADQPDEPRRPVIKVIVVH